MAVVLQNVVFPTNQDPDVLPLYADPETWATVKCMPLRLSDSASIDNVLSRHSARVRPGKRVSYATYFNAFPASYWQRWTVVRDITLNITTSGTGTVIVYRSNSGGQQQRVESRTVKGEGVNNVFQLPLNSFGDGGWYWFDLIACSSELVLDRATWETTAKPVKTGKVSLGMCTFNKAEYCVETLANIAADPALREVVDKILLVDQGTAKVKDRPEFPQIAAELGDQLRVIHQGNLGGSGGYSRAMAETLQLADTDFLLLLDDDIEFETESAIRALQFGRFSSNPVIVGGHMFDLYDKPVLHAWAEHVKPGPFLWGPSFPEQHRHNFKESNLRQTPWMHARLDADYNGWWMSLIPKQVIADIGLSLPVFIKWDDSEYSLRAAEHGYRTVSLPGVALWHMSWLDKDDSQDWQAYFHTRNRIIAGLLHSTQPRGGKLMQNSSRQDIKKLLNMQYYAVQLSINAMRDVLAGPEKLHSTIKTVMPEARALMSEFGETRVWLPDDADHPVSRGGRSLPIIQDPTSSEEERRPELQYPTGINLALFTAKTVAKQWLREDAADKIPELEYAKRDALWWHIPKHESVIIGSADGRGKMWYRHDRAKFRRMLREIQVLRRQIERNWDTLAKQYREALPHITSVEMWLETFEK